MASIKKEGNDADPSQGGKKTDQLWLVKMSKEALWHGPDSIVEAREQEDKAIETRNWKEQWSGQPLLAK